MRRAIKSNLDVKPESLKHIRALAKAKQRAGRFALFTDQLGRRLYISKSLENYPITFEKSEAKEYYEGFDSPSSLADKWQMYFSATNFMLGALSFNAIQTKRPKYGKDKKEG